MLFPSPGIDKVGNLFAAIEGVSDEGAKHPMLLIDVVEERADVTVPAQGAPSKLDRAIVARHKINHLTSAGRNATTTTVQYRSRNGQLRRESMARMIAAKWIIADAHS